MIVGRTYYERGEPVVVLASWRGKREKFVELTDAKAEELITWIEAGIGTHRTGPRNVIIQRKGGSLVCRPFRGLRKNPPKERA